MLGYCPHVTVISTTRSPLQNDKVKVDCTSAKHKTCTSHPATPNGIPHTANHMNGHVVSARHPVLGLGYKIVDPPKEVLPRRAKMAPSTDPGPTVRFNKRVCSISNSHDGPLRRASLPQTEEGRAESRSPPKLLRSQSTQTDSVFRSEKSVFLSRSPSAPPLDTCSRPAEPVQRPRSALGTVSRSARARCSDTSSSDVASGSDSDSSFSARPGRDPAEDYQLSAILIGDSGTGKTCLVTRLAENVFIENYDVTVGIDFNIARFNLPDGRPVRLQLWDTAGQEKYRAITSSYYRKAMGVVLVYDVTRRESLTSILNVWRKEVEQYADPDVVLMLVGNKMDLDDHRTITTRVGVKVAAQLGAIFFEVSAKEDLNVRSAFRAFGEEIVDKVYSRRNPCLSSSAVHLDLSNHDRNSNLKAKSTCNC